MTIQKTYPYILIVGSIIGLIASFILTLDTISMIKNPNVDLPCNINPFISCTSVASSKEGSVFGFPNSLLGIISFSILFGVGVMLFSGGKAKKPFWLLLNLATLASMFFVFWFFSQSVYDIGSLCIYCMTVWAVTWPIFLYTTIWNYEEKHFELNNGLFSFLYKKPKYQKTLDQIFKFASKNHTIILSSFYILAIFLILLKFRDFFLTTN